MDWQEIVVTTTKEASDAVANLLQEQGSGGVVIDDPEVVREYIDHANWDAYALPESLLKLKNVKIKAYYPINDNLPKKIEQIKFKLNQLDGEIIPGSLIAMEFSQLAEEDWAHAWKAFYKPVKVGQKIVIKPTWEDYKQKGQEIIVELDPGMAFGTGTHDTTVMCIQALEEIIQGGEHIYDVGTGSGVLAITAAKLGADWVKAIDLDEVAVKVATQNVEQNHVADKVRVMVGNLLDMAKDKVQIVVANIIAVVIVDLCPAVAEVLPSGGVFIASGIIDERWPQVQKALIDNGFNIKEVKRSKEWVAVIAEKGE